jgi:hypothetical protein
MKLDYLAYLIFSTTAEKTTLMHQLKTDIKNPTGQSPQKGK